MERVVSRVPHTEHNAPCGRFSRGLKEVKKNRLLLQAGQMNFITGTMPHAVDLNDILHRFVITKGAMVNIFYVFL